MQSLPPIPGYELCERLGGGPLTCVFAAREEATGRPCAVKALRNEWQDQPTAVKLLRYPFLAVLFVVTFFDATVHQMYFVWTGRFLEKGVGIPGNWVTPVMSIGQVAEIGTLAVLAFALRKLGWRYTMVIGILGHAVRFAVFAFFPQAVPAILVNVLHGICYAFFFATVYMFVEEFFPKDARASAQGLFNVLILGVGPLCGTFLGNRLGTWFQTGVSPETNEPIYDFRSIFLVPAGIALAAALTLLVFFHPPQKKEAPEEEGKRSGDSPEEEGMKAPAP